MIWFPDLSTIVSVGGITIKWYAFTLVLGCIVGYLYLSQAMKAHGYKQAVSDDLLVLILVSGIVGGRIFWVLENMKNYSLYAWYVFAIGDGGIDILGSLQAISLVILLYGKKHHLSFRRTMDVVSTALLLTITIARVGRALELPSVWYCVGINIFEFLIIYCVMRTYSPLRRRGDAFAVMFMLTGFDRLAAMAFHWDPLAVRNFPSCIVVEVIGILLWSYSRFFDKRKPVVLFDFDGTIMDSEQMIIGCFAYLFQKYGNIKDFTKEVQQEVFGPPLRDELKKLFPDQNTDVLMKEYTEFQKSLPGRHLVSTLPHVEEVLKELKKKGYVVAIVTSRLSESCETWVEDLEIEEYIDLVVGTERYRHAKPKPDGIIETCEMLNVSHDSVMYVGDNVSDVQAGKNAGVYTVGFITNEEKREKIEAEKPNATISDIKELLTLLDAKHAWSNDLI